jgi:dTDP-4-dehydrorhamnose reductase
VVVLVLGHKGMLGRRVMEQWPNAETIDARSTGTLHDPLLEEVERIGPDWIIDCAGATNDEPDMWAVNAILPWRLHRIAPLIQPSTDHVWDDTEYARSKRLGECGHVIRCAIVDPEGGLLARARDRDTYGESFRQWNGITAKSWARLTVDIMEGRLTGTVIPGSPTISHFDLLETARAVFGWKTRTVKQRTRVWYATPPSVLLPPIETQLREYLCSCETA